MMKAIAILTALVGYTAAVKIWALIKMFKIFWTLVVVMPQYL